MERLRSRSCPECERGIPAEAVVCPHCSADLHLAEATAAGVVVGDDPVLAASSAGARWGMVAVTIIIIALVVVLAILLLA